MMKSSFVKAIIQVDQVELESLFQTSNQMAKVVEIIK
jgi:hypothetical protein